jgi:ADP-ribose pyrophosphatase YjhB (NUDIX family)
MIRKRKYCTYCGEKISRRLDSETERDYCASCNVFFYDNPLPVASVIVIRNRELLLVKRKFEPYKGMWCLPSGFAETGESIESAALRELKEETGIEGKIIDFVCAESIYNNIYGDLVFITYEAEWIRNGLKAGDDAESVQFFPLADIPVLAFESNMKAVNRFMFSRQEYWSIVDSSSLSSGNGYPDFLKGDYLSRKLIDILEKNAEVISNRWLHDVKYNKSTPHYANADQKSSLEKAELFIRQFGQWLGGNFTDNEVRHCYTNLGKERKSEGFGLSEVLSAISLTRKHVWEFALSQGMWNKNINIYMTLELERRMMLFFDKASYYVAKGFEMKDPETTSPNL